MTGKLVKLWSDPKGLPVLVALSLAKAIKTHPAVGWVRADQIANAEVLAELNEVRKKNEELQRTVNSTPPQIANLAGLDSTVVIWGMEQETPYGDAKRWKLTMTWGKLFAAFAPYLLTSPLESSAKNLFRDVLKYLKVADGFDNFDVD